MKLMLLPKIAVAKRDWGSTNRACAEMTSIHPDTVAKWWKDFQGRDPELVELARRVPRRHEQYKFWKSWLSETDAPDIPEAGAEATMDGSSVPGGWVAE